MNFAFIDPAVETTLPSYATDSSAGLDIRATSHRFVSRTYDEGKYRYVGGYHEYGTNLAVEIPAGFAGLLVPKSSSRDFTQRLANSVGIIDSDYRGELFFSFKVENESQRHYRTEYKEGDVVGQLVLVPAPIMDLALVELASLSETARGGGGHGSTEELQRLTPSGLSDEQQQQVKDMLSGQKDKKPEPEKAPGNEVPDGVDVDQLNAETQKKLDRAPGEPVERDAASQYVPSPENPITLPVPEPAVVDLLSGQAVNPAVAEQVEVANQETANGNDNDKSEKPAHEA